MALRHKLSYNFGTAVGEFYLRTMFKALSSDACNFGSRPVELRSYSSSLSKKQLRAFEEMIRRSISYIS